MLDRYISITEPSKIKDKLNHTVGDDIVVANVWGSKTESGGRENVYASRIVNEGEVIYTVRWRADIRASQWVVDGDRRVKIIFTIEEGRRKWLHLKCKLNNG